MSEREDSRSQLSHGQLTEFRTKNSAVREEEGQSESEYGKKHNARSRTGTGARAQSTAGPGLAAIAHGRAAVELHPIFKRAAQALCTLNIYFKIFQKLENPLWFCPNMACERYEGFRSKRNFKAVHKKGGVVLEGFRGRGSKTLDRRSLAG
eukprot:747583-Hanusia_phi.AAC.4